MLNTLYDYLVWRAAQMDPKQRGRTPADVERNPPKADRESQAVAFQQWALAHADG